MSTYKHIDKICAAGLVFCLLLTIVFMNGKKLGIQPAASIMGYEERLFNTRQVHTIDIVMDDWEDFLETCENEEYAACSVVIDGDAYKNIALRAKGNTSLSTVSSMNSERYSLKLEFDHYDSGKTYYGLDKLCLNNIIQDATYMKDYLTYQMMASFGADAPLCSYAYITVNGNDWGLYLAVEGIEDAFLQRNYGSTSGELYKPDSMGFGGGRGNGRAFSMGDFMDAENDSQNRFPPNGGRPEDLNFSERLKRSFFVDPSEEKNFGFHQGGPGGGMGSDDVKLRYIDDDPDSYSNIFQNAKSDVTEADQVRLINALKNLSSNENLESTIDVDEVIRYFVVHNFVCNGDSYTGSMVHNYYLYEENGQLSMIPWDYNLAFGTFQGQNATSTVNSPIDTPVSGSDSRPMLDWIFNSEEYTAQYHQYFQEFLTMIDIESLISQAAELIAPYVEKDPTAFYSYEEFQTGAEALKKFCRLRSESVTGQLSGTIASVTDEQISSALVDASSLNLSDMGSMNHGSQNGEFADPRVPGKTDEGRASPFEPEQIPSEKRLTTPISSEIPPSSGQALGTKNTGKEQSFSGQNMPERPERNDNRQGNDIGSRDMNNGSPPGFSSEGASMITVTTLVLLSASLGILLVGIFIVFLYRRRK